MGGIFQIVNFDIRSAFALLLFAFCSHLGMSQNSPILKFQKDSVLIGELTPVNFTYKHSADEEVIFADSTFDFTPFEFEKIEVYSTKTLKRLFS